jgi:hypothetical protein
MDIRKNLTGSKASLKRGKQRADRLLQKKIITHERYSEIIKGSTRESNIKRSSDICFEFLVRVPYAASPDIC